MNSKSQSEKRSRQKYSEYGSGPDKIMKAAEKLFGQKGFEATSVREICLQAGQSNNSAVTMHFGSKDGLVKAIRAKRLPEIDTRRAILLSGLSDDERRDTRKLLECLVTPWLEDVDDEGERSYAKFVAQMAWANADFVPFLNTAAPATVEITQLMRNNASHLSEGDFNLRSRLMLSMFLTIVMHEGKVKAWNNDMPGAVLFDKVIDMLVAVFEAPCKA